MKLVSAFKCFQFGGPLISLGKMQIPALLFSDMLPICSNSLNKSSNLKKVCIKHNAAELFIF